MDTAFDKNKALCSKLRMELLGWIILGSNQKGLVVIAWLGVYKSMFYFFIFCGGAPKLVISTQICSWEGAHERELISSKWKFYFLLIKTIFYWKDAHGFYLNSLLLFPLIRWFHSQTVVKTGLEKSDLWPQRQTSYNSIFLFLRYTYSWVRR